MGSGASGLRVSGPAGRMGRVGCGGCGSSKARGCTSSGLEGGMAVSFRSSIEIDPLTISCSVQEPHESNVWLESMSQPLGEFAHRSAVVWRRCG